MTDQNLTNCASATEKMDYQSLEEQMDDNQITVKYSKLMKKCEQIKMENFRLINYIDQINKLVRKVKKQNAFICTKLDQNNDDYHKLKPTILQEIDLVINYGRTKLNPNQVKQSIKVNEERDNDLTIHTHRNKRIKIENKVNSSGNQMSNLAGDLTTSNNIAVYQITNNSSSYQQFID